MGMSNGKNIVLDLNVEEKECYFGIYLEDALLFADKENQELNKQINETKESIKILTPDCDKLDYILAASSGAICGILDIFLVGKPGESPIGDITDKWFEERTKDFAKMFKWDDSKDDSYKSAIRHLEKRFGIPYDQRGAGDAASEVFDLRPSNHHFKSLGHNPTLLGLFYSILDQFSDPTTSHFVTDGELITLQDADNTFKLQGHDVPSKLFCAIVNWLGHLVSDVSGSKSSKGRGTGIPSPIWCWTNDVIAIKRSLGIPVNRFDKDLNELALKIYLKGYDIRFQTAQLIPVFINEMVVRLLYTIRRLLNYYSVSNDKTFSGMWKACDPFTNASVKRMLTVAHGTFCLVDTSDTVIRGFITGAGNFNLEECVMRLNIPGIGRFAISIYGEIDRFIDINNKESELYYLNRKKIIIDDYISGLEILGDIYDDKYLLDFVDDLKKADMYKMAFEKTVELAKKRNVSDDSILKNKSDIDEYFGGGNSNG